MYRGYQRARGGRREDRRDRVAIAVDRVRALPERTRYDEREERSESGGGERERERGHNDHQQEQRDGERARQGQAGDRGVASGGDEVVEDDEAAAPIAVEECAGDRTGEQAGHECGERRDARECGRAVLLQDEEHEYELDHLRGDPPEDHPRDERAESLDPEETAVARRSLSYEGIVHVRVRLVSGRISVR